MICPHCGFDNLPGSEECGRCLQDLTQLDRPTAQDRVEHSLMVDPVKALGLGQPVTVSPMTSIRDAMRILLDRDIGALLVVNDSGKLVGIFSERDLLMKVAGIHADYFERPVQEFMTLNPETVEPHHTLAFVLHKMDCGSYRHIPVLQDGQPVGILSVRNMLRHITRLCKGR